MPARTASAVERLVAAGAVVVGKANLHEFAWGVTSQNPWYGTVHNPAHPGRMTGGSSGGNAAALAAGLCDLGIGTDTGGSIRLPAACCGVVGLKPAWGRIPTDGVFPLCPTFDTVGPMATTVADVALAVVRAHRRAGARAAARRPDRRPADAPAVGRRAAARRTARPSSTSRNSRSSARRSSRRRSRSRPATPGRSSSTRRPNRTARRSPRAPTSTATTCARSSSMRRRSTRPTPAVRASRCAAGASTGPTSTSTWRRRSASRSRRRTATSSRSGFRDGVPAAVQRARLGRRSRSAIFSSSRRATRSCSRPVSRGSERATGVMSWILSAAGSVRSIFVAEIPRSRLRRRCGRLRQLRSSPAPDECARRRRARSPPGTVLRDSRCARRCETRRAPRRAPWRRDAPDRRGRGNASCAPRSPCRRRCALRRPRRLRDTRPPRTCASSSG